MLSRQLALQVARHVLAVTALTLPVLPVFVASSCQTTRGDVPPAKLLEPVPLTSAGISRGQVLYMRYCHTCHPNGQGGLGPSLLTPLPAPLVRTQIRVGAGGMPRFSDDVLADDEVDAILLYLDTLRDHLR